MGYRVTHKSRRMAQVDNDTFYMSHTKHGDRKPLLSGHGVSGVANGEGLLRQGRRRLETSSTSLRSPSTTLVRKAFLHTSVEWL